MAPLPEAEPSGLMNSVIGFPHDPNESGWELPFFVGPLGEAYVKKGKNRPKSLGGECFGAAAANAGGDVLRRDGRCVFP